MKWIDASKKNPEDGVAVLVYLDSSVITVAYKGKNEFVGTKVIITWHLFGDIDRIAELKGGRVTHWHPLPEPPTKK